MAARHKGDRHKCYVLIDYDTFAECFALWQKGQITLVEFGKKCGVTYQTISNRLKYVLEHQGKCPAEWFTRNGEEMSKRDGN